MQQFAYSFAITMMHSIWQMALLLMLYKTAIALLKKWPPLAKRNLLFLVLLAQLITSAISFYLLYSRPFEEYGKNIQLLLNSFIIPQNWLHNYSELIFILYTLVVIFKLGSTWLKWNSFTNSYHSSLVKASIDIRLFTQLKAFHFGIHRKVAVWCSLDIHSPITFGFLKPVILLPLALVNQLSAAQTESLIIHELTHIKQHDYLFNWLILITESLYFFNPFVKIISNKINLEREKNCDMQVLQFNYPANSYAETLLQTARRQQMAFALQMGAVKDKAELLQRIHFFSNPVNLEFKHSNRFSFVATGIWIFVLVNSLLAGYFLCNHSSSSIKDNTAFTAMPVNDWNKSFNINAVETSTNLTKITAGKISPEPGHLPLAKSGYKRKKVQVDLPVISATDEEKIITLTPASFNETLHELYNEIIINEETSSGKTITKYYQISNVNGETVIKPLLMTSEIIIPADSLKQKLGNDSNLYKIIPLIQ